MKKAILATLLTLSTTAAASEIKYDYLEVSKQKVKAGEMKFEGSGFSGAMLTEGGLLLTASKRDLDTDLTVWGYDLNMGIEVTALGMGFAVETGESTDFFFVLQYLDIQTSASMMGFSVGESAYGTGATAGIRSMITSNLELTAEVNYVNVSYGNTSRVVGAHYHLSDSFSLGVNYERDGDESGTSIVARMYF